MLKPYDCMSIGDNMKRLKRSFESLKYKIAVFLWNIRLFKSSLSRRQYPIGLKVEIVWRGHNWISRREKAIYAFKDPHPSFIRTPILTAEETPENFETEKNRKKSI